MFSRLRWSLSPPRRTVSAESQEKRKRNRLSKLPTNSSTLSLQSGNRISSLFPLSTNSSIEELQEYPPPDYQDEQQELVEAQIFNANSGFQRRPSFVGGKSWTGATYVVTDLETQPSFPPRAMSASRSALPRLSLISDDEDMDAGGAASPGTTVPSRSDSSKSLTMPTPVRGRSLVQPYLAARTSEEGRSSRSPPREARADTEQDSFGFSVNPDETADSEVEKRLNPERSPAGEPGSPPPVRTETPSDLVVLGGLQLGSLHVTNGCASPVPSEISRSVQARSVPNLASGVDDHDAPGPKDANKDVRATVKRGFTKSSNMPGVPQRPNPQAPWYRNPLRFFAINNDSKIKTACKDSLPQLPSLKQPEDNNSSRSRERYKSPARPLALVTRNSSFESNLEIITKTTEWENAVLEDESVTPSVSDSADNSTLDTFYTSTDVAAPQGSSQENLPQNSRPIRSLVNSRYSSNISMPGMQEDYQLKEGTATEEGRMKDKASATTNTYKHEAKVSQTRQDWIPGPRAIQPSMSKEARSSTASLPNTEIVHHSSTTVTTVVTSTASSTPLHQPRRLSRRRGFPRSSAKEGAVQGNHDVDSGPISPIPMRVAANLATQSQEAESAHTYERRPHIAKSIASLQGESAGVRITSPIASVDLVDSRASPAPPPPLHRRFFFRRHSKPVKTSTALRNSQTMNEADVTATTQDLNTVGGLFGGSGFDTAATDFPSAPPKHADSAQTIAPRHIDNARRRPKSTGGVDAESAAKLAQIDSQSIHRRASMTLAEKRNVFNDRGGVPGKNFRPLSFAGVAPPLPPLPAEFEGKPRHGWALPSNHHQKTPKRHSWIGNTDDLVSNHDYHQTNDRQSNYDHWEGQDAAYHPGSPARWGAYQSSSFCSLGDLGQTWNSNRVDMGYDAGEGVGQPYQHHNLAAPPLPPPHLARATSVAASSVTGHGTEQVHGHSWQNRRNEAASWHDDPQPYVENSLRSKSPRGTPPLHLGPSDAYAEPSGGLYGHPDSAVNLSRTTFGAYDNNSRNGSGLPSQANSYKKSLAESLHPAHVPWHPSLRPQIGRYSGGLSYGYEAGSGFYGSAGTGSVSGVATASRKGKALSQGFGVDLSDVPIIATVRRVRG